MVLVEKFFCCAELETGGFFTGYWGVASLLLITSNIWTLVKFDQYFSPSIYPYTDIAKFRSTIITLIAISLGFEIIDLFASVLVFLGTLKRYHPFLRPWLISRVFYTIYLFLESVAFLVIMSSEEFNTIVVLSIGALVALTIFIYTWIAIYSLYVKFRNESTNQPDSESTTLIDNGDDTGNPIYS